jgi:hypothetical protein
MAARGETDEAALAEVLPFRMDAVGIVIIDAQEVLEPRVAIERGPILAELD